MPDEQCRCGWTGPPQARCSGSRLGPTTYIRSPTPGWHGNISDKPNIQTERFF